MNPDDIPSEVKTLQVRASDPSVSVWVAANAGAGKTHVLAQRVIRLLLAGVKPEKILCITFTKAAASNMANRIFGTLSNWTALDDTALDRAIRDISHVRPDTRTRELARRLFATALETPGGLKVQTIHAFCTRLLHQFPFEANVAARFTVLDEAAETQLLEQINLAVLLEAAGSPDSPTGKALAIAIASASDQAFRDVVSEAIRKRTAVTGWLDTRGGVDGAIGELCETLGVNATDVMADIETAITEGPLFPSREWPAVAATLQLGSKQDQDQAARFADAAAEDGSARLDTYLSAFFVKDGPRKSLITRALARLYPELTERLAREGSRLTALTERRRAVACRDRTRALLTIAQAVLTRYRAEKDRRGLLDYDDLIEKTLVLLGNVNAAWVHYKLDQGIDHVLIDEAQDTSPRQWEIINRLTGEFFSGAGARMISRTMFGVGDEKQSIFSFQDAVPRAFADMGLHFGRAHERADMAFQPLSFSYSFRSGAVVLKAVDTVFKDQTIYRSITTDIDGPPPHMALPKAPPGMVELWPMIEPQDKREIEAWDAPFDVLTETSPQVRLANRIATHIRTWIGEGAKAGEVLILVRQRGSLFESIIRALKEKGVPVAGADRLVLTEHIAVMDLMALGDALLLPHDDLALASVLKSPLFGLDDDDLFRLAHERKGSLRRSLREHAAGDVGLAEIARRLDKLTDAAAAETPFAFYARVLQRERGRQKFLARLGAEANDALDEFLNVALDYENRETPSLQGFLAWLRGARTDVKRDMEMTRDEVRVMTVHGAKGLEARIVILADTTTRPAGPPQRQPRVMPLSVENRVPGAPVPLVWAGVKATDTEQVGTARNRMRGDAEDEYRRLLYVAMTRAAEKLVICGARGERANPPGCWYELVFDALRPLMTEEPADDDNGEVWRFRGEKAAPSRAGQLEFELLAGRSPTLPDWIGRDAAADTPHAVAIAPSRAGEVASHQFARSATGASAAARRGVIAHRLLQSLPDIPAASRTEAAQRHLARSADDLAVGDGESLMTDILALLDDARFAPLFRPGSRAEIPIVGRIPRGDRPPLAVSGQIDRLVVTPEAVLIVDYKTNRPAPKTASEVPPAYIEQLALYRRLLTDLYPGRIIRAALLWTDVPDLMEISGAALDAALAAVTAR